MKMSQNMKISQKKKDVYVQGANRDILMNKHILMSTYSFEDVKMCDVKR